MDVSVFHTRTAAVPPAALQAGGLPSSELSGTKGGAAGFLDLLLASLAQGKGQQEALTGTQDASGAGAPPATSETEEDVSLESFLASLTAGLDAETSAQLKTAIGAFFGDRQVDAALLARIQTTLENASDAGESDLAGLLNLLMTPGAQGPAETGLETDKTRTGEDVTLAALLTANLTPEQIADLARRLSEDQKTAGAQTQGAAFLAALLTQDQSQTQPAGATQAPALLPKTSASLAAPAGAPGEESIKTDSAALTLAQTIARIVDEGRSATKSRREARFADLLGGVDSVGLTGAKLTSGAATSAGSAGFSALKSVPMNGTQKDSSGLTTFPGGWGLVSGLESTFSPDSALAQWLERLTAPAGTTGAAPAGSTSSAAMGQSPLSGAHPASQIVAAAMIRTAQNGETKTLTLNLEPPELGRVEIRMEMGRDRSIKTVLSVEKPETLSLLQRDAHLLERALQNAGFDASGESVQFELAQDGGAFDPNGNGSSGGQGGGASGQEADDSDAILIETHLDWFIDPRTGAQRYDLYV